MSNKHITEIMPPDMPQWMWDAIEEGLLARRSMEKVAELEALVQVHIEEPIPENDPMRKIGERLTSLLDEDDWNWFEPKLNGIRKHITDMQAKLDAVNLDNKLAWQEVKNYRRLYEEAIGVQERENVST